MFDIQQLSENDAIDLISALLAQAIPPTAIAKAFNLDPDLVREMLTQIRVKRYGTAEISEAMVFLRWKAYDAAVEMLHTGSPANRLRTVNMLLSYMMRSTAKDDPEEFTRIRTEMQRLIAENVDVAQDLEPGEFVLSDD
jgi:hypothetical protein